jgi:hypothetical protein
MNTTTYKSNDYTNEFMRENLIIFNSVGPSQNNPAPVPTEQLLLRSILFQLETINKNIRDIIYYIAIYASISLILRK